MKRLIILIALVLGCMQLNAQTDLEIANLIIGKNISQVDTVLSNLGLEYYITVNNKTIMELYIVKNNSVRRWEMTYKDIYTNSNINGRDTRVRVGKRLIYEIFVRYRHSNLNDLRGFFEYEAPKTNRYIKYEKEHGSKLSHLRVIHIGYYNIVTKK